MRIDPFTRFANDEGGAVAIIVALLLTVLIGFTAIGVDVASLYRERSQLQGVSDLTAISAMARPEDATTRAHMVMGQNGKPANVLKTLQMGRYLRNPAIAPDARFTALPDGAAGINAVRVVLQDKGALHFAQVFTDKTFVTLTRTAQATRTGAASFALDSHLVQLSNADLDLAIIDRFGASASIGVGGMQVLENNTVNLGALLETLAAQTGNTDRNPADILNDTVTAGALLTALQSQLPANAQGPLNGLAAASGSTGFTVASLIGGIDTDLGLTATDFAAQINLSALDVVRAVVGANTAGDTLNLSANIAVPNVIDVQTAITANEPPAQSGWIALGEEGAQLHRAALRLQSDINVEPDLLGFLGVGVSVAKVHLPIYTELAGSTASLEKLSCVNAAPDALAARFSTAQTALHPANGTSVAALYLGALPSGTSATTAINPADLGFADLLTVNIEINLLLTKLTIPGVVIQARSHVGIGASQIKTISFSHTDVTNGNTTKSFGSGDLLSSAIGDLFSPANTELRVKPGQSGLFSSAAAPIISTLLQLLPSQLGALTAPVDSVLDATLAGVGVELGTGELTLTGHHCEPLRLVK